MSDFARRVLKKRIAELEKQLEHRDTAISDLLATLDQVICNSQGNGLCVLPKGHEMPHYNPRGGTWHRWG